MTSNMSQVRQNYHEETEAGVNKQINLELHASYTYQSMAAYFNRDDVALPGFAKHFDEQSKEERGHADKLIKYQNKRGGRVVFEDIKKPAMNDWGSPLVAMKAALDLEKCVNQALLQLHAIGQKHNDPEFTNFIEGDYLSNQLEEIKANADHITNLKRVGEGLGEFEYDRKLLQAYEGK